MISRVFNAYKNKKRRNKKKNTHSDKEQNIVAILLTINFVKKRNASESLTLLANDADEI